MIKSLVLTIIMLQPCHSSIFRRRFNKDKSVEASGSVAVSTDKTPLKSGLSQLVSAFSPKCHTKAPSFNPDFTSLQVSGNFYDNSPEPESSKFEEALQFLCLRDIGCTRKQAIAYTSRNARSKQNLISTLPKNIRQQFRMRLKKDKFKPYNYAGDDKDFEFVSKALNDIIEQKEVEIDVNSPKIPIENLNRFFKRNRSETKVFSDDGLGWSPKVNEKCHTKHLHCHISPIAKKSPCSVMGECALPEISPLANRFHKFINRKTCNDATLMKKSSFNSRITMKKSIKIDQELSEDEPLHVIKDEAMLKEKIKSEKLIKSRVKSEREDKKIIIKKQLRKKPIKHHRKQSFEALAKTSKLKKQLQSVFNACL